jgi:hypothetical protein
MLTECIAERFDFGILEGRAVEAAFDMCELRARSFWTLMRPTIRCTACRRGGSSTGTTIATAICRCTSSRRVAPEMTSPASRMARSRTSTSRVPRCTRGRHAPMAHGAKAMNDACSAEMRSAEMRNPLCTVWVIRMVASRAKEVLMSKSAAWKRPGSPIGREGPRKANPKYKRRSRERWSAADLRTLQSLARGNTPTGVISLKLQRPPAAIRSKAQREGISLKPVNRSPYNRRHKTR